MVVYSFKDSVGGFSDPDVGNFAFAGQIGLGEFSVGMATERTAMLTAADGTILPSAIAGNSGHINISVQQTSVFHQFLLNWLNTKLAKQNGGDVTTWAGATLSLRNVSTNTYHTLTGLCPSKMPDIPYQAQGQNVTWMLMAADIQNG